MKTVRALIALGLGLGGFAGADPIDDARLIVDRTTSPDVVDIALDGVGELMLSALQNEFRREGKTLSDDAGRVYVAMLSEHMVSLFTEEMREPMAEAYVANLSPEALSAYRAFLETEEGQEIALAQPILLREGQKIGAALGKSTAELAVAAAISDMEAGRWPDGTLKTTQAELRELFELPPVSEDPPAR